MSSTPQVASTQPQAPCRTVACVVLSAYCFMLGASSGCALLGSIKPAPTQVPPANSGILDDGYTDVAGVIHVHTTYSHDAHGTFEDVVRAANAQSLDYVITTEHNNLRALREGKQGWHGAVLVLIGEEISTRSGHYLALNVTEEIDRSRLTPQQIIDEVNRQGGLGFIAHPYFKHCRWRDWTVSGFTGMEAYNVAHDTLDENKLRLALWTLTSPPEPFYLSIIDRPYDPLARWDHLIQQHSRVVGIGSTDAHEFHLFGVKFAPYEIMFRMIRTHLLVPATPLTPELVYDALRRGHAYLELNLVADAEKDFTFFAEADQRVLGIMGDEVTLVPRLQLTLNLPSPATLTLFKDGAAIQTVTGTTWRVPVIDAGVYRLEASKHGRPWIISNPIYIRPAPWQAPASPSASATPSSSPSSSTQ